MAHTPVLLKEVIDYLHPQPGELIIDGTAGGGGHTEAILSSLKGQGKVLAIDWDEESLEESKKRVSHFQNVVFVKDSYARIATIVKKKKLPKADGLLLDLGFSSSHVDASGRGFSFQRERGDEPLLMTYSDEEKSVREILRELQEEELSEIIRELGGERMAGRVARAIKEKLRKGSIETSGQLAEVIRKVLPRNYERGRIDPATRTFQALRIYANHELENLRVILEDLPKVMNVDGRVAIITFHSLEDRIVKQTFKELAKEGDWQIQTKKPIIPSRAEVLKNPRSRSAKLRVIKRTEN